MIDELWNASSAAQALREEGRQEGHKEGHKEGRKEGQAEGRVEEAREMAQIALESRFGSLAEDVLERAGRLKSATNVTRPGASGSGSTLVRLLCSFTPSLPLPFFS